MGDDIHQIEGQVGPRRVMVGKISPEAPGQWSITLPYSDDAYQVVMAFDGRLIENHMSSSREATGKILRVIADELDPPAPTPEPEPEYSPGLFARLFGRR